MTLCRAGRRWFLARTIAFDGLVGTLMTPPREQRSPGVVLGWPLVLSLLLFLFPLLLLLFPLSPLHHM